MVSPKSISFLPLLSAASLALLSCTKLETAGGPLDGNYVVSTWTCGSNSNSIDLKKALQASGVTAAGQTFNANNGTVTLTYGDGCAYTNYKTYSYPSGTSTFLSTYGTTTCSGNCKSSECSASAAPSPAVTLTYNYTLNGLTLTATRTLAASDISNNTEIYGTYNCTAGMTETYVLTRQ